MVEWSLLTVVVGLAVLASLVSIRLGISVAILEILAGILAGNYLGVSATGETWLPFLAGIGSVVLTFLAGAEIDPVAMRKTWKASATIGILSFLAPFLAAWGFTRVVLGWTEAASLLAGVALSTTSVAVVYVVLVETGGSRTPTGKLILSACFITDLGTALALSLLFVRPNEYIFLLLAAVVAATLRFPGSSTGSLPASRGGPVSPRSSSSSSGSSSSGRWPSWPAHPPSCRHTSLVSPWPPFLTGTGRSY